MKNRYLKKVKPEDFYDFDSIEEVVDLGFWGNEDINYFVNIVKERNEKDRERFFNIEEIIERYSERKGRK